jgi:pimeloyl-ACP methyl ester carboxylesterase
VSRLVVALASAFALVVPGGAAAAIPLTPCGKTTPGLQCGTVQVPLDRSGNVPGTISLHVEVLPAEGTARGVMFLVAGGPGQGSAKAYNLADKDSADFMRAMLPGYTLVAFDNRGTGSSGLINCPSLQKTLNASVEVEAGLARDCAAIIGPPRQFYATRDHVEDTDAVRAALGFGKIGLFGVSYGTKLSLAYALGHPQNVDRLLLDSIVVPTFPDPFERNVLRELPSRLSGFCSAGVCRAATSNFAGEFVSLANRLEARPISGKVIVPSGRATTLRMNGENLVSLMIDADLSPGLAAELPAAVHAALGGYARPLLRLFDLDLRANELSAEDLSFGLYAATNCADGRFPWSPQTPPAERRAVIDSTVAALPQGSFGQFGTWSARLGNAFFCEQWPSPAGNAPLGPGPFPDVPMLEINGGFDMRTPVANALTVLDSFPQGRLVTVPGVGHSAITADLSGCAFSTVRDWILGRLVPFRRAECPRVPSLVKILGAFPKRLSSRTPSTTLAAAAKTLREAEATWLQAVFASVSFTPRGLFGGRLVIQSGIQGFSLKSYSSVPGVAVSGKLKVLGDFPPFRFSGTVRVTGPAGVGGTLRVTKSAVSGKLGGRPVKSPY